MVELPCGHEMHGPCVYNWLVRRRATCPLCKADVDPEVLWPAAFNGGDAGLCVELAHEVSSGAELRVASASTVGEESGIDFESSGHLLRWIPEGADEECAEAVTCRSCCGEWSRQEMAQGLLERCVPIMGDRELWRRELRRVQPWSSVRTIAANHEEHLQRVSGELGVSPPSPSDNGWAASTDSMRREEIPEHILRAWMDLGAPPDAAALSSRQARHPDAFASASSPSSTSSSSGAESAAPPMEEWRQTDLVTPCGCGKRALVDAVSDLPPKQARRRRSSSTSASGD